MKNRFALAAVVAGAVLGGCATYVEQDPYYGYDAPVVRVAPPPPPYEYPGYPPAVGHVWIGGYWNWVGVRYVWVPGRWQVPRPGYLWVPHRWERQGDYWRPHGGRWEPDHRPSPPRRLAPPPPAPRGESRAEPPPRPGLERRDGQRAGRDDRRSSPASESRGRRREPDDDR